MKKLAITIAIIFGLGMGVYAQGGLFGYGAVSDEEYYGSGASTIHDQNFFGLSLFRAGTNDTPIGVPEHGQPDDQDAPLGGGVLLLIGFGAAYALKKKREE